MGLKLVKMDKTIATLRAMRGKLRTFTLTIFCCCLFVLMKEPLSFAGTVKGRYRVKASRDFITTVLEAKRGAQLEMGEQTTRTVMSS